MKSKLHNNIKIFEYLTSTEQYKIIFILLVIMSIFGRLQISTSLKCSSSLILPFSFPLYHYALILVFLYSTITICKLFDDEFDQLFIRYKTKNKKIKIILSNVISITLFSLLIYLLLYISIIVFTNSSGSASIIPYNVSDIVYTIYVFVKISSIILIFQIINTLLYFLIKEKTFAITLLYFIPFYLNMFANIKKSYIFVPWLHQLIFSWNTFGDDLLSFCLCICFLNIVILLLYKLYNRWS